MSKRRLVAAAAGMDAGQVWEALGAPRLAQNAKQARGRLAVLAAPAPPQASDLGRRLAASRGARGKEPGEPARSPRG